jgi:hypothetical protein
MIKLTFHNRTLRGSQHMVKESQDMVTGSHDMLTGSHCETFTMSSQTFSMRHCVAICSGLTPKTRRLTGLYYIFGCDLSRISCVHQCLFSHGVGSISKQMAWRRILILATYCALMSSVDSHCSLVSIPFLHTDMCRLRCIGWKRHGLLVAHMLGRTAIYLRDATLQ